MIPRPEASSKTDDGNRTAHLLSSKQPKATMPPLQPILIRLVGNRSMWKNADPDLLATAASIRVAACVAAAEVLMAAPVAKDEGAFQKMEAAAASPLAGAAGISLHGAVEDRLSQHDGRGTSTGAMHFIDTYNLRVRRFRRRSTELTVFFLTVIYTDHLQGRYPTEKFLDVGPTYQHASKCCRGFC